MHAHKYIQVINYKQIIRSNKYKKARFAKNKNVSLANNNNNNNNNNNKPKRVLTN